MIPTRYPTPVQSLLPRFWVVASRDVLGLYLTVRSVYKHNISTVIG